VKINKCSVAVRGRRTTPPAGEQRLKRRDRDGTHAAGEKRIRFNRFNEPIHFFVRGDSWGIEPGFPRCCTGGWGKRPRRHAYIAFICCGAAVTELLTVGSSWQEGKECMDTAVPGVPDRRAQ
jgi:hypothetical protein